MNHVKNFCNNVLDLVLLTNDVEFSVKECQNPLVKIDKPHPPIECELLNGNPIKKFEKIVNKKKAIYNYKRANFISMNNYFRDIELDKILINLDVDKAFKRFYDTIN